MDVEVWSDIVCPWCYIGQRRLRSVLEREGRGDVIVVGRSFELNPVGPRTTDRTLPELLAERYGLSESDARMANARVTEAAAHEGLEYHLDRARPGNTFDAHRLLQLATRLGRREPVEERFMRAYFTEGEPIADTGTLRRLAVGAGLASAEVDRVLAGTEFADDVRREEDRARQLGARGVPFFRFENGTQISGAQPAGVFVEALRRLPASLSDPERPR
jgi:predicted DsbA family dithiol-disulfide isomerase